MATYARLDPVFTYATESLLAVERAFYTLPGSAIIERYVRSSHQNDPGRTLLELILFALVVRTLLQSRTRADESGKHFIEFSNKEIDELVADWNPEALTEPLDAKTQHELDSVPVVVGQNGPKPLFETLNFTGLSGHERMKERGIAALRQYAVGSCGPMQFYGGVDAHYITEMDIAEFLGAEAAVVYSQGMATITSVLPAFCKRGDIVVADRGISFPIQKAIEVSRCTVRWYDHNDINSLEDVLKSVEKERRKKGGKPTRQFIVTEGLFEKDGQISDLPKLIELKKKYKYRLILEESYSFGVLGRTGRGLTELYNVPATEVDLLVGCMSVGLCAGGGFCAGSKFVIAHQRVNGAGLIFSASIPPLLACATSEAIDILRSSPSLFECLQENVRAARAILDRVDCITIPSHPASPMIHIQIKNSRSSLLPSAADRVVSKASNPASIIPREAGTWDWDIEEEENLLRAVVDEALSQGVLIMKAKRLREMELVETKPSIRLALTSALTRKETEKAVGIVKAALVKVLGKRRL
ncbi:PLP-dependent transferase [Hymenopellis radicata]|nr:PLP-dependent transferase [Hymenopellis radicata]